MRFNNRSRPAWMWLVLLGLVECGLHRLLGGKVILAGFSARFKLFGKIDNYLGGNAAGGIPQFQRAK